MKLHAFYLYTALVLFHSCHQNPPATDGLNPQFFTSEKLNISQCDANHIIKRGIIEWFEYFYCDSYNEDQLKNGLITQDAEVHYIGYVEEEQTFEVFIFIGLHGLRERIYFTFNDKCEIVSIGLDQYADMDLQFLLKESQGRMRDCFKDELLDLEIPDGFNISLVLQNLKKQYVREG